MTTTKAKKVASIAFTGAAAAAAGGLNAAPAAAAAGHWVIDPGGPYTATNVAPATLNANGVSLSCSVGAATASGSLSGTSQSGAPVQLGTINQALFGQTGLCSLVGFGLSISASLNHPAQLWGNSYNSTTGVTNGTIRDISATIHGRNFACEMVVSGSSLPGFFSNGNHQLAINTQAPPASTLRIKSIDSISNCLNVFQVNQPAWFSARYDTNPPQTITQE